jgi:di/tricarboxylate transporter
VLSLPLVGEYPIRITLAVALVSGVMSAFISNTATPAMMVAIVAGILSGIEEAEEKNFAAPIYNFQQAYVCVRHLPDQLVDSQLQSRLLLLQVLVL